MTDDLFNSRKIRILIGTLCYILFIASLLPTLLSSHRINSDTVTGPLLAQDLLQNVQNIFFWNFPPAPALISDAFGQYLLFKITGHYRMSLFILTTLQASLLFILLWQITKQISKKPVLSFLISTSIFVWIHLGIVDNMVWLYAYANNMHMGAIFIGLYLLYDQADHHLLEKNYKKKWLILGLVAISFFESRLFVISYLIPICLLQLLSKKWLKTMKLGFIFLTPLLFSFSIEKLLNLQYEFQWSQSFSYLSILRAFISYVDYAKDLIANPRMYPISFLILFIFSLIIIWTGFRSKLFYLQTQKILIFSILSFLISILGIILMGRSLLPYTDFRYLVLPIFLWILIASSQFSLLLSKKFYFELAIGTILVALSFTLIAAKIKSMDIQPNELQADKTHYHKIIDCINSSFGNNLYSIYGYTGYWSSKTLRFFSDHQIHTQSKLPNYEDFKFMNNTNWEPKDQSPFNFILLDDWIDEKTAIGILGQPIRKRTCPSIEVVVGYLTMKINYQVFIYNEGQLELTGN